MLFSFIDHQQSGTGDGIHELINKLDGTQVVVFSGDDEIRTADLGATSLRVNVFANSSKAASSSYPAMYM
jgi:hypothetical protein